MPQVALKCPSSLGKFHNSLPAGASRGNTIDEAFPGFRTAGREDLAEHRVSLFSGLALWFLHASYTFVLHLVMRYVPANKCVQVLDWCCPAEATLTRRHVRAGLTSGHAIHTC